MDTKSVRSELVAKLSGAQISLENKLAELRAKITAGSDNLGIARLAASLAGLSELRQQINGADPATLTALQSQVSAAIATVQSSERQTVSESQSQQAGMASLYQASVAARHSVDDFEDAYYKRHVFDQYLQFASKQDEDDYHRREAERQKQIDKSRSEDTPEGNLRANELSIDQMKDAGAHGANRSPEYKPMLDSLEKTRSALSSQVASSGKATSLTQSNKAEEPISAHAAALPADVIAQLKQANVALADQSQGGHGVSDRALSGSSVRTKS